MATLGIVVQPPETIAGLLYCLALGIRWIIFTIFTSHRNDQNNNFYRAILLL